jgi:hypothetical protein
MSIRKRPYSSGVRAPVGSQANIVMPARAMEYEEGQGFNKDEKHLHQITEFAPIFRHEQQQDSFQMRTLNSNFHQKITGCFSELRSWKPQIRYIFLGVSLGVSDPTGISNTGSPNLNFPLLIDGLVSTINTSNVTIHPGTLLTTEVASEHYPNPNAINPPPTRRIPNKRMRDHVDGTNLVEPSGKRMTEADPDANLFTIRPKEPNDVMIIGRATNRSRPGEQLNFICKPTTVLT